MLVLSSRAFWGGPWDTPFPKFQLAPPPSFRILLPLLLGLFQGRPLCREFGIRDLLDLAQSIELHGSETTVQRIWFGDEAESDDILVVDPVLVFCSGDANPSEPGVIPSTPLTELDH